WATYHKGEPEGPDPESQLQAKEAAFRRLLDENPQLRYSADKAVNPQAFAEFCRKHPQLVRRLRDHRHLDRSRRVTPRDIVDFLARNRKLPTRYFDTALGDSDTHRGLKPAEEQFPNLPPRRPAPGEAAPEDVLDDAF